MSKFPAQSRSILPSLIKNNQQINRSIEKETMELTTPRSKPNYNLHKISAKKGLLGSSYDQSISEARKGSGSYNRTMGFESAYKQEKSRESGQFKGMMQSPSKGG